MVGVDIIHAMAIKTHTAMFMGTITISTRARVPKWCL